LAGYPDPRKPPGGGKELIYPLERLFRRYRDEDPAPQPQLALPVALFHNIAIMEGNSADPTDQAVADLTIVAFFYLLRVGEYTMPRSKVRTRTVQFRVQDVQLWGKDATGRTIRLPNTAPLAILLSATAATLTIDNQKNGNRSGVLHHDALPTIAPICPVRSLVRRLAAVVAISNDPKAPLSLLATLEHVTAPQISSILKLAAFRMQLFQQGYPLKRIGAHSLRASGAMGLKLNGVEDSSIQKLGRWRSQTWLTYLHSQISHLTSGLSAKMATPILFYNIGAGTTM
jgi:hypothetical protein